MISDLTWNNYLELNDYINSMKFKKEYLTPVVIIQWEFYGLKFKFRKIGDEAVIMYIQNSNQINLFNINMQNKWMLYASYYNENFNFKKYKDLIWKDLQELNNGDKTFILTDLLEETYTDWELNKENLLKSKYISNYIYEIEKMKTFAGKKLQKKRNHLNSFIKDNHNLEIKNIRDVDPKTLIEFSTYHIKKYAENFRQYEIDVYKKYLFDEMKKDDRYQGAVIYIDDKIVAFTLGFVNHDTYEVIIEKAERDIRGLYQYTISANLKFNNIQCQYMDREDDAGLEALAKSKASYYPLIAVKRYSTIIYE